MSPRDLYFVTYHQAAHVVSALVLGCPVDFVDVGDKSSDVGWDLETASLSDIDAVCAAGFEMEILLGRLYDSARERSQDDRSLLASIHADRTGISLTALDVEERFDAGALSSMAILQHKGTRLAIDNLAELLMDAHAKGETRLTADQMTSITAPVTGFASKG